MNHHLTLCVAFFALIALTCCKNHEGKRASIDKDTLMEAPEAEKKEAMDLVLSEKNDGKLRLWHIHSDEGRAYCDVTDEEGRWAYEQEGKYDGERLYIKGHTLEGTSVTLHVTRAGDGFRGTMMTENDGKHEKEDIQLRIYQKERPCPGHPINFEKIHNYFKSLHTDHSPAKEYALFDIDDDGQKETLWVRGDQGSSEDILLMYDPRSGHTAYITHVGVGTQIIIQGHVIHVSDQPREGYSHQVFYIVENNQIGRKIEVVQQYNGMTGQMDASYKDVTEGKSLSEKEYNAFTDTLVAEGIPLKPSWTAFPL